MTEKSKPRWNLTVVILIIFIAGLGLGGLANASLNPPNTIYLHQPDQPPGISLTTWQTLGQPGDNFTFKAFVNDLSFTPPIAILVNGMPYANASLEDIPFIKFHVTFQDQGTYYVQLLSSYYTYGPNGLYAHSPNIISSNTIRIDIYKPPEINVTSP